MQGHWRFCRETSRYPQPDARGRLLARDRRGGKGRILARRPTASSYALPRKLNSITAAGGPDAPRPKRSPATMKNEGLADAKAGTATKYGPPGSPVFAPDIGPTSRYWQS